MLQDTLEVMACRSYLVACAEDMANRVLEPNRGWYQRVPASDANDANEEAANNKERVIDDSGDERDIFESARDSDSEPPAVNGTQNGDGTMGDAPKHTSGEQDSMEEDITEPVCDATTMSTCFK